MSDDDDVPIALLRKRAKASADCNNTALAPRGRYVVSSSDEEEVEKKGAQTLVNPEGNPPNAATTAPAATAAAATASPAKKGHIVVDSDEESEEEEKQRRSSSGRSRSVSKDDEMADFVVDDDESDGDEDFTDSDEDEDKEKKKKKSKKDAKKKSKKDKKKKEKDKKKKETKKKTTTKTKTKKATATKSGRKRRRSDDDDDYENSGSEDDSGMESDGGAEVSAMKGERRWKTLSHNGPLFPPEYVPHGVPLVYDGERIVLPPEAEEAASFYARYLSTERVENKTFNSNFFKDFRALLRKVASKELYGKIKTLSKCDFTLIERHLQEVAERKKAKTKSEKERQKKEKEAERAKYGVAVVDGVEQRIGNYVIEPPGLFLGRGEHPMTGKIKKRIMPEDVTLNLGVDAPVPPCPVPGHHWGKIVHDDHVTWLANWHEGIKDANKYVWLHSTSTIKGASDQMKYETARKLKDRIAFIRASYMKDLRSRTRLNRQRATAIFLIDKLALRVGGEKGDDEADTVGCCSLRVEHISFPDTVDETAQPVSSAMFEDDSTAAGTTAAATTTTTTTMTTAETPHYVKFDFLAKDSMRYLNVVRVPELVWKNLHSFTKASTGRAKKPADELFDELSTASLNKYLKSLMDGLTAKVFRTYNASITLQRELAAIPDSARKLPNEQKLLMYNRANRQVAILCNHQRTIKQSQFSAGIGGLKLLLVELLRKRGVLAKQYKALGGSSARLAKLMAGELGADAKKKQAAEAKRKKDKKSSSRKKKKKDDSGDFEGSNSSDEDDEDDDTSGASQEAALAAIDENAIKDDDEDIQTYMRVKEERARAKEQRDRLVQEAEAAEAQRKVKADPDAPEVKTEADVKTEKTAGAAAAKTTGRKVKKEAGEEEEAELEKEKKAEVSLPQTVERCEKQILMINERILKTKLRMVEKGELRNVALSTSKLNYLDPRISVAFCKRLELPLERVFQKALREKFTWALDTPADFQW